jgi:hypothetical protein
MKFSLKKHFVVILLATVLLTIGIAFLYKKVEPFENNAGTTIVSNLDKRAGFYSMLFFTLNHYIFCRTNRINFRIKSDDWLFKSNHGWTDYFEDVKLNYYDQRSDIDENVVTSAMGNYAIHQYKEVIPEFYRYNERTKHAIAKTKQFYNLIDGTYDTIFIRRGDKLGQESKFLSEEYYLNLLLEKSPHCKTLFIQTDDYNSYLAIKDLITNNDLDISVHTLCDPNSSGVVVYGSQKNILNDAAKNNTDNKEYLATVIDKLNASKSVEEMNSEEIYKHSMDMIIGIDILINSNVCVTDYQSNVSRFIKLAHKTPENVYNIMDPLNDIDYDNIANPAYGF